MSSARRRISQNDPKRERLSLASIMDDDRINSHGKYQDHYHWRTSLLQDDMVVPSDSNILSVWNQSSSNRIAGANYSIAELFRPSLYNDVRSLFTVPEDLLQIFNVPFPNEVCVFPTLNASQSYPDNDIVVQQRDKKIVTSRQTCSPTCCFSQKKRSVTFGFATTDIPSISILRYLNQHNNESQFRLGLAKHLPPEFL